MVLLPAILLIGSFAALVTVHVALCAKLLSLRPRRKGVWALLAPPLAPFWGWKQGLHKLSVTWLLLLAAYLAAWCVEWWISRVG